MNSSPFMDKQIMGLSGSAAGGSGGGSGSGGGELFDLMNPQEELHGGSNGSGMLKKDEILPSYDFQPIRTVGSSSSSVNVGGGANLDGGARHSWGSVDSKIASATLRYSNILEPQELPKVNHEKGREAYDVATVTEIDRTVKKYADNLLHTLEGVSSRLVQLESRTRHLENSVDELKVTIGNNSGSTDGKLRQLENILREVQTGVQVLRDKQEISEAQIQLTKLQSTSSKSDHYQPPPTESSNPTTQQPDPRTHQLQPPPPQAIAPAYALAPPSLAPPQQPPPPQPSYQPPPPSLAPPQQQPPLPAPNAPPPPPTQQQNPPQFPSLQQPPSYFPSSGPQQQPQSQPPPPQPQYYQLPQYSQQMLPPQPLNPSPHLPEESAPYMPPPPPPSQTYPPNIRPPPSGPPQHYQFPSSYAPPPSGPTFSDAGYPYNSGSPSHYTTAMKQSPFSNSPPLSSSGSGNYSRLPTAKILPQVEPAGTSSGGGGGSGSGRRVPIDDVVDKVVTMGFSREQVRATVGKLTEKGQSVDLNVVLDKLMNEAGGEMIQPQKGWFGR